MYVCMAASLFRYVGDDVSPDFYAWVFPKYDHVGVGTGTVVNRPAIKMYQKVRQHSPQTPPHQSARRVYGSRLLDVASSDSSPFLSSGHPRPCR